MPTTLPNLANRARAGWECDESRNASQVEHELRSRELIIRFLNDAVYESEPMWVARALMHHVKVFDRVDGFVGTRPLGFFARRKLTQLMRESLARG